jgi:hypothetical protein
MAERWVKVIFSSGESEEERRRPFCMNIENVENFKPSSYQLPATKERLQNRNPLKRDVYRIGAERRALIVFSRRSLPMERRLIPEESSYLKPEDRRNGHYPVRIKKPRCLRSN